MASLNWSNATISTALDTESSIDPYLFFVTFTISGVENMISYVTGKTQGDTLPSYFELQSTGGTLATGQLLFESLNQNTLTCTTGSLELSGVSEEHINFIYLNFAYDFAPPSTGTPQYSNGFFGGSGFRLDQGQVTFTFPSGVMSVDISPPLSLWRQTFYPYSSPAATTGITDLASWNGTSNAYLMNDIFISSASGFPITVSEGVTLDGRGHTITINNLANFPGLFNSQGGVFQYFMIDTRNSYSPTTPITADTPGFLLSSMSNNSITSVYYVSLSSSTIPSGGSLIGDFDDYGGGFVGNCSSAGNFLVVCQCFLNVEMRTGRGGGIAAGIANLNVSQSFIVLSVVPYEGCGGIVGSVSSLAIDRTAVITNAVTIVSDTGGFVYENTGVAEITNSYFAGSIADNSGVYTSAFLRKMSASANIIACYAYLSSAMNNSFYGSFVGEVSSGTLTVGDVAYSTNRVTGNGGSFTPIDNSTPNYVGGFIFYINHFSGAGTWNNAVTAPDAPLLSTFQNSSGWSGYNAYNDVPTFNITGLCLLAGTEILTTSGYRAIETIRVGDEIVVEIDGELFVRPVLKKVFFPSFGSDNNLPYIVPKDYYGEGRPFRDLIISRCHALRVGNRFHHISCSKAFEKYEQLRDQPFDYHHLCVEEYPSTMFANGIGVETCAALVQSRVRDCCSEGECKIWVE
jgi:hypothetical protein